MFQHFKNSSSLKRIGYLGRSKNRNYDLPNSFLEAKKYCTRSVT